MPFCVIGRSSFSFTISNKGGLWKILFSLEFVHAESFLLNGDLNIECRNQELLLRIGRLKDVNEWKTYLAEAKIDFEVKKHNVVKI